MSLNGSTGVISGTPNTVGRFTVTITGHDVTNCPPGTYAFQCGPWLLPCNATGTRLRPPDRSYGTGGVQ